MDTSANEKPGEDVVDEKTSAPESATVAWWRRRVPLFVPAVLGAVAIGTVAVMGGQLANRGNEVTDLEVNLSAERSAHQADTDKAAEEADAQRQELDQVREDLDAEEKRADEAEKKAFAKAEADLAGRVAELETRGAELDGRSAELDGREADLAAREQQLEATLNGLRASQFGDGVHQVGRDIQPGRYHTDGGVESCYYSLLGPDGRDILDNNIVDGPATVIIDSAFFESSRCGTWTKIG